MGLFNFKDSLTKTTSQNVIYTLGIKGMAFIVSFIYIPIILHCLDEQKYGIWIALTSIVTWIGLFDIGIGNGLKNKLTEALAENNFVRSRKLVSTAYYYTTLIFLTLLVVLLFVNYFIKWDVILNVPSEFSSELFITAVLTIIAFCIRFILQTITPVLIATQYIRFSSLIELIGQILSLIGVYVLSLLGIKSLIIFSAVVLFAPIITLILASIILYGSKLKFLKPALSFLDSSAFKDIFSLGVKFFIIQIACVIIFQTNSFLIANNFGPNDVTIYNVVYKYFNILPFVWGILMTPLWPSFTHSFHQQNYSWIKKTLKLCMFLFGGTLVALLAMLIFGNDIIKIWLQKDLNILDSTLLAMALFALVSVWNNIWGSVIGAIGKVRLSVYVTMFQSLIFFPTFFLLKALGFGIDSAIYSMVVSISSSIIVSPIQVYYFIYKKKKNDLLTKLLS